MEDFLLRVSILFFFCYCRTARNLTCLVIETVRDRGSYVCSAGGQHTGYEGLPKAWVNVYITLAECMCSSPLRDFIWRGSWYASFARIDSNQTVKIACSDLFSDVIYRPFQCAHTPLESYTTNIPKRNEIRRLANLTACEFAEKWTCTPFILTEAIKEWPVCAQWSEGSLLRDYADVKFRAEAVDWPLRTYIEYMNRNADESPLYLFDRAFAEKMDLKVGHDGDYWTPQCFGEDLFAALDEQRPDSRWLIVGPERSGSTFHKDPNATR